MPSPIKMPVIFLFACLVSACGQQAAGGASGEVEAKADPSATDAGEWRRVRINGQPALAYAQDRKKPLAALRCDSGMETLFIDRMGAASAMGVERMTVRVDGRTVRLPVTWDGASPPTASAMLKLEDRLTDGLTRLGGTIEIELGKQLSLTLPPDRRIGTLVEECRQAQLR